MNGALERLRQGDLSSLSYILDAVDMTGMQPNVSEDEASGESPMPADAVRLVINVLAQEGHRLMKHINEASQLKGQPSIDTLPSDDALTAMRILLVIGSLRGTRGAITRRAISEVGVQGCRRFALDAYFALDRSKRYYAVNFVNWLTVILRCKARDLLFVAEYIELASSSSMLSPPPPRRPAATPPLSTAQTAAGESRMPPLSSTEAPRAGRGEHRGSGRDAAAPSTTMTGRSQNAHSPPAHPRLTPGSGERRTHNSGAPQSSASATLPVVPTLSSTEIGVNISSRSRAQRTSPTPTSRLPGSTADGGSQHHHHNSSNSSATRSAAPHGTPNRALETFVVPINGASVDIVLRPTANPTRRFRALPKTASSTPFPQNPLFDAEVPLAENVLLAAQFPTPVVLFSRLHGLGCLPKLPTSRQYQELLKQVATSQLASREDAAWGQPRNSHDSALLLRSMERPTTAAGAEDAVTLASPSKSDKGARRGSDVCSRGVVPCVSTDRRTSMHAAADDPNYYIFPTDQSGPATVYHQLCRDHWLLSRYLDDGLLVGWGCMLHGALGTDTKDIKESATAKDTHQDATAHAPRKFFRGDEQKMATPACYYKFSPATARCSQGRVVQVSCGRQTTFVVSTSGSLYSCGRCENGQLGLGERSLRYEADGCPSFRRIRLKDGDRVVRVAAGVATTSAMTENNFLYLWGYNKFGQCMKQPDAVRVLNPIRFRTGKINACDVGCGLMYGCLVFSDGAMATWGFSRMLGRTLPPEDLQPTLAQDGSQCRRHLCQLRLAPGQLVAMVSTGPWHAAAVTKLGQVLTWGAGAYGRLGHNSDTDEIAPRLVEALRPVFVVAAACGNEHTAAVTSAGEVYMFGDNAHGQLGVLGRQPRRSPVQLVLPSPALAVSCGSQHTCVLLQNGDVVACGALRALGCGLGCGGTGGALVRILQNYLTLSVACGSMHTMALTIPRTTALCRVGHSTIEELSRMESVLVRHGVRAVASGCGFLHILSESGKLLTLGRGERGQTGLGDAMKPAAAGEVTVVSSFQRVPFPRNEPPIEHVCCGPDYVLALDCTGAVYGWGSNASAQLGMDPAVVTNVFTPARLSCYTGRVITQLACGGAFVVSLTEDSEVLTHGARMYCGLGGGVAGEEEGQGDVAAGFSPSALVLVPTEIHSLRGVTAIAAGMEHAAALTVSGLVYVWGKGVLGTAPRTSAVTAHVPTKVLLSCTVQKLGCGPRNTFVISAEGELYVWGCNKHRQCGTRSDPPASATSAKKEAVAGAGREVPSTPPTGAVSMPTRVLRGVRDAAFTARFCLAALESGEVRVAGRLRHQGTDLKLSTFAADPQPQLSVTLNGHSRRGSTGATRRPSETMPGSSTAGQCLDSLSRSESSDSSGGADDEVHAMTCEESASALGGPATLTEDISRATLSRRGRHASRRSALDLQPDIILNEPDVVTGTGSAALRPHSSENPPARTGRDGAFDGAAAFATEAGSSPTLTYTSLLIRRTLEEPNADTTQLLDDAVSQGAGNGVSEPLLRATVVTAAGTAPTGTDPPSHAMKRARSTPTAINRKSGVAGSSTPTHALRAFGGWEQVFVVVETDRPNVRDVQRAHRGLQVYRSPAS